MKFLLASLKKNLLILKSAPKAASNFCSGFPLLPLVNYLPGTFKVRLSEQFSELQPDFGTTLRETAQADIRMPEQAL